MRSWTTTVTIHGGPRAAAAQGLIRAHTRGRSGEWELTVSWGKGGALGGPHRGLRWPVRRRGEAGGSEGRTAAVKLGVGRVETRRSGTKGSTRCGDEWWCERNPL
jgi:hypothetical protein